MENADQQDARPSGPGADDSHLASPVAAEENA